jgi:deoxycytidylate deaminase
MRYLDEKSEWRWMEAAAAVGRKATCGRSKCGSVIVSHGTVIGEGYNSPAGEHEARRRCGTEKTSYDPKVTDKTCCVHAEQRAIMDALRRNADAIVGSRLYFIRLDGNDEPKRAGEPYCTICSKMALDVGIGEFVLWREDGLIAYPTDVYDEISCRYGSGRKDSRT